MPLLPTIKLDRGVHVMHLFYSIDRVRWSQLPQGTSVQIRRALELYTTANANPSHPRILTYANIGGKADIAFFLAAAELGLLAQMHRELESIFPVGTLSRV